ncbi:MAG: hypothetical protein KBS43_03885 [Oscillospiraceae bacterium]|nr:hypothetical protein [Candidatus Limimonas coprohippi]
MKTLKSNSGMTLVEIVLAILIMSLGTFMLAEGFSASARITNHATLIRNSSVAASSSLEVEEAVDSKDDAVNIEYSDDTSGTITVSYNDGSGNKQFTQNGQYAKAVDTGSVNLKYREFCPNNFSFEVPADPVGS